jgi:hypothetical protein
MTATVASRTSTFGLAVGSITTLAGVACLVAALSDFFMLAEPSHTRFLGGSVFLILTGTIFLVGAIVRRGRGD